MERLIKLPNVNDKIVIIRKEAVILDNDIAELYGVQTRDINKSVKNNPDKFPKGYIFEISNQELENLRWKNSTTNISSMTRVLPKAFTERGLYMLATILKSPQATQTTIAIIEAFTKMRATSRSIAALMEDHQNDQKQKSALQKCEEVFGDIIGNALETASTETSFELNLAALKIKHTVKRSKKK